MISPNSSVGKGYQYFWPSRIACLSTSLEQAILEGRFFYTSKLFLKQFCYQQIIPQK
jgi:hypothetical protein